MKKRIRYIILCIMIVELVCFGCASKEARENIMINDNTIERLVMYYPGDNQTIITQQEYIQRFVQLIQSMSLEENGQNNKDGYMCLIDIYYDNGDESTLVVSSKDISFDGQSYKPDRDYCDDFRELYSDVADKSAVEDNIDITEVEEVRFSNPENYMIILKQEDMQLVIDAFKSMKLTEVNQQNNVSREYGITIKYKDDSVDFINISSSNVEIRGIYYETDRDYSDDFKELFERLSETYTLWHN